MNLPKKKKFDGKIEISPRKIYIILVLVVSLAVILRLYGHSPKEPAGEYGKIGNADVTESSDAFGKDLSGGGEKKGHDSTESASDDILSQVPDYSEVNRPAYALNGNKPYFTEEDYINAESMYIELSELDYLGRCGVCTASLGQDTLAEGERDFDMSDVRPSGWRQERYPGIIDEEYHSVLYNRCHLIMYAISGLTSDERNLVTGTVYMNNDGMLPWEKAVQNYLIRKAGPGERVLYRATPVFKGSELVCRGIHIEAADVKTRGEELHINMFCYNVQPGIGIDYFSGRSWAE